MNTGDLFQSGHATDTQVSAAADRVTLACHRLAVEFTEANQLPIRYRKCGDSGKKQREPKADTEIEKRFRANVQSWRALIETMLAKLDGEQAWRFIDLYPRLDGPIDTVSQSRDFCDFIDYMILRRDKENCDADELGGLAQLSVAFQRVIEKKIKTK